MKNKIPKWQIKKNLLDLEYKNAKDWVNNLVIILATLTIGFFIALLQNSIPQNYVQYSILIVFNIIAIIIIKINGFYNLSKSKLQQIKKLKA